MNGGTYELSDGNGHKYTAKPSNRFSRKDWMTVGAVVLALAGNIALTARWSGQVDGRVESMTRTVEKHVTTLSLHEGADLKTARIRAIVDREVKPQLDRIENELIRLNEKLDR